MTETIPALLRQAAAIHGDKAALCSSVDGPISFVDLDRAADRVAKALLADGMEAGERSAIWASNMWELVAVAVGVQRIRG